MIMSIVMQFLMMGGLFTLFKNQVVGHLISADILNVNFFFFSNSLGVEAFMRLCVICGISLSRLCLFLGIYRWTDEDVVMLRNTALARHGHQTSCLILQRDSQISGSSSI